MDSGKGIKLELFKRDYSGKAFLEFSPKNMGSNGYVAQWVECLPSMHKPWIQSTTLH